MLGNGLWFDPRSLQRLVDDPTWSRGLMLYRNQQVESLDIEPGPGYWLLRLRGKTLKPRPSWLVPFGRPCRCAPPNLPTRRFGAFFKRFAFL
jgi:hypothetical protein